MEAKGTTKVSISPNGFETYTGLGYVELSLPYKQRVPRATS
jgi:hypothetical protein